MCTDEHYMHMAVDEARVALVQGEIPVGAVAVYLGQVIGRGHNSKETQRDPTAHAEMIALRQAAEVRGGWRLSGVTLYCTMEPCAMCAGAMIQARIPRLVYAVNDPKAGAGGSLLDVLNDPRLNHQVVVTGGILADEAKQLLTAFFRGLRDGTNPRWSGSWRESQLAQKANPL